MHRAKVLSSGALRGRILRRLDDRQYVVRESWGACDDFVAGFDLRVIDSRQTAAVKIRRYRSAESIIELASPPEWPLSPGTLIEVCSGEPAPILAARLVTQTPAGCALPPIHMRLATTRGTNALLERRGARMALFITEGFGDLLAIGDQQRPELFALKIEKPLPLAETIVEVRERCAADGDVLVPLDESAVLAEASRLIAQGIRSAAVALMHSHVNAAHEQRVRDLLLSAGFTHVSCSSELAPLIRLLPRAQTAVADAYLAPIVQQYLQEVASVLATPKRASPNALSASSRLHVMTSAGGLVRDADYHSCDSLLSGPAGGVAGAAAIGRQSGFDRVISFDMGGTSTDVARFDGDFEYRFEHTVGGVRLVSPALAIETVAAGGGSICDFCDGRLTVGPDSAGAIPGPACYGLGGPLTLTDANVLLGRIDPEQFEIPINPAAAQAVFEDLFHRVAQHAEHSPSRDSLLEGLLEIANERMAAAIEQISVRRGYDPKDYAMVSFGGAGGQHACAVAQRLGIQTVLMPADASLLSAYGLGAALIERFAQRQVLQTLNQCSAHLQQWLTELATQASDAVLAEGVDRSDIEIRRCIVNLRLLGQDTSLPIDLMEKITFEIGEKAPVDGNQIALQLRDQFVEQYVATYGHAPALDAKPIEVESIRVVVSVKPPQRPQPATTGKTVRIAPHRYVRARFDGQWRETAAFDRSELKPGARIDGPALVFDRRSVFVIESNWRASVDSAGTLIAQWSGSQTSPAQCAHSEIVQRELFTNRFASIAADMGQMLQRTSLSTNVKERLDFSCALLDAEGELIVNAPHIPVHLGALGLCVRTVRDVVAMDDGDVIVTNHPAYGGSHLPDITVITPVYCSADDASRPAILLGYVASRAHHAEIGGTRPGSMPPNARSLAEEGVVIPPMHLLRRGISRFDVIEKVLRDAAHPSRAVTDNLADLQAQVAANHRGAEALRQLAKEHGAAVVIEQMRAIKHLAESLARRSLAALPKQRVQAIERLDDGSPICVTIDCSSDHAVFDFAGTAAQHAGNLNATPAIVRSAVLYVLRLLIGERLPLNEGIMHAIDLRVPEGLLNPQFTDDDRCSPAVVGGNTETSQRVVDTLLKALGIAGCSQGTMNNVLFGNERFGYYETVCGGSGAGPDFHGADAVHTHMTNTRMTDPEIIEHRYPVRVNRFTIRRNSGGDGRYRGGCGAVREITFLAPMSLSVLTQHRVEAPFGLQGGKPGKTGRQRVVRAGGEVIELHSIDGCEVEPGDCLILETPGGGGFGAAGQ